MDTACQRRGILFSRLRGLGLLVTRGSIWCFLGVMYAIYRSVMRIQGGTAGYVGIISSRMFIFVFCGV